MNFRSYKQFLFFIHLARDPVVKEKWGQGLVCEKGAHNLDLDMLLSDPRSLTSGPRHAGAHGGAGVEPRGTQRL